MRSAGYAYAVGKIRALEKFLIKREVFEDAVASTLEEALRFFVESDLYGEELLQVRDSAMLEQVLEAEASKLKRIVLPLIEEGVLREVLELKSAEHLYAIAERCTSVFLRDFFLHVIDMHNIKTYLRLLLLQEPPERLALSLTCEGFIPRKELLGCYGKEHASFLHRLSYVHKRSRIIDYAHFLKEGIDKALQDRSFVMLESAIQDLLIRLLQPAKRMSFGPEPVVGYYVAKLNEIKLIRMVILAKLNNVSAGLVEEALHGVYA